MEVTISARPDGIAAHARLSHVLSTIPQRVIACSGGIDSLVLAVVAFRARADSTIVAHTVTPAVPGDGTARVVRYAGDEGWDLRIVRSGEFDDEAYLANPVDRCYHCKRNLYDTIAELAEHVGGAGGESSVILSGANLDDLGEYRPGLAAAGERSVRHPYVEAAVTKSEIRAIARFLGVDDADLPASPCLASRLYTGTRVTESRMRAVEVGEALVREQTGIDVVRCRIREHEVLIEVTDADRHLVTERVLDELTDVVSIIEPSITSVSLDATAYAPGRSFVAVSIGGS